MAEERFIRAIQAIYQEDVTDRDRKQAIDIKPGETKSLSKDRAIPTAKVIAEDESRYEALKFIYKNWERAAGNQFDPQLAMLLIEMNELLTLWRSRQEHTCIIRACSFFESYFVVVSDIDPTTRFGPAIDAAAARDIIDQNERKLYHFIREVRNECGHNAWLQVDFPRELLIYSCTTSNFLIQELADRKLVELGSEPFDGDAKPKHFLDKLERDFQWSYKEEDGAIKWTPPDTWSHPERSITSYEDYWDQLDKE